ncbi:GNAT family N-acetyltransferase [uncultured Vibrio sp.]|uniref:GNAT family N-acetyltransferase n=1 Tax=uncultured Vibrio sp. TaxID=114054 RepID=UPI000919DA31|nr:GNAT family N-acetyltransferase [uncultured Vibrio sp.]OIQ24705.1 MAG: GNAT family N-acetyltransferase [Vibrio sp. MedPE-SWchi]
MTSIDWQTLTFNQLTTVQLYELLKLRVDVFVVEQNCPYPELDNKDIHEGVYHLLGYKNQELVACARLLPQGVSYSDVSIGRIATSESARGNGLGNELVSEAIQQSLSLWPNQSITIGAQHHLARFYQSHGFVTVSEMYLEDGIPHIDMTLAK